MPASEAGVGLCSLPFGPDPPPKPRGQLAADRDAGCDRAAKGHMPPLLFMLDASPYTFLPPAGYVYVLCGDRKREHRTACKTHMKKRVRAQTSPRTPLRIDVVFVNASVHVKMIPATSRNT